MTFRQKTKITKPSFGTRKGTGKDQKLPLSQRIRGALRRKLWERPSAQCEGDPAVTVAPRTHRRLRTSFSVVRIGPLPKAMKIPAGKAAVEIEWETLKKLLAWGESNVRDTADVIRQVQAKKTPFTPRKLDTRSTRSWQNIHKSTKDENCAKDDTECIVVFTAQGASASQMTAAAVLDAHYLAYLVWPEKRTTQYFPTHKSK